MKRWMAFDLIGYHVALFDTRKEADDMATIWKTTYSRHCPGPWARDKRGEIGIAKVET